MLRLHLGMILITICILEIIFNSPCWNYMQTILWKYSNGRRLNTSQGELYPPFMIIKWVLSTSQPVIQSLISCSPFSIRNTQAMLFWDKLTFQLGNIQIISGLATHNSPAVLRCWFSPVQEWLIQKGCWLQYPNPSLKHMVLLEYGELLCSMFSWRRNLWPIQPAQISKCY